MRVQSPSRSVWVVAAMCLLSLTFLAVAQQPAAPNPGDAPKAPTALENLAIDQGKVADKYARLEQLLIRMSELEATSNPQRAALLKRAAQQSSEKLTRQQLNTLVKLLAPPAQLKRAVDEQQQVITDLKALLELLQSENRADRLKNEQARIKDYIKEVDRIIRIQKGVQGRTEGGDETKKLATDQDQVADRTGDLAKKIQETEEPQKSGDANSDEAKSKDSDKSGEKSSEGKSGENKSGDKSGEKKSGENKDTSKTDKNQDKNKDGQKSDPSDKSPDKENQESKSGDKSGEPKNGDKKDSDASGDKNAEKNSDKNSQKGSDKQGKSGSKSKSGDKKAKSQDGQPAESPDSESQEQPDSPQEQDSSNPARKRLQAAEERMRDAQKKLEEAKQKEAQNEQQKALEELEKARAELEEILRQMREEEIERTLAMLEGRFRRMLESQLKIYESTKRLDKIPAAQRSRDIDIQAGKLGFEEGKLAVDADKALLLLREEGSSVAFPETVELMRDDMQHVAERLSAGQIDRVTQGIEEEIIQSLEELIAALQQAQENLKDKKQEKSPMKPQSGDPADRPLVDRLAELKMIRALQLRVNTRTQRYSRLLENLDDPVGAANDADLRQSLVKLAEMEKRVHEITRNLVLGKNE